MPSNYHTPEQLETKKQAIELKFNEMMIEWRFGNYSDCVSHFHNDIEILHQLLKEYKQG